VLEDKELSLARDVGDDPLADHGGKELPAAPPDLSLGADREPVAADACSPFAVCRDVVPPLIRQALDGPRVHEVAPVPAVGIGVPGNVCLRSPEHAHNLCFDAGFFARLAYRRFLDRLALVDSAARYESRELGLVGGVVDEKLVGAGSRVLAGDVDDDVRSSDQLFPARILALWARLAS
jgi:hypothetical protein